MNFERLGAMVRKEFVQMRRDPTTLRLMLVVPVMQLLIFGFAVRTDVRNLPTVIFDQSRSQESRAFVQSLVATDNFVVEREVHSYAEALEAVDAGRARAAVVFPPDYARSLKRGDTAPVQVLVDASDPTASQSAIAAAQLVGQRTNMKLVSLRAGNAGSPATRLPVDVRVRPLYNPALANAIFIVPGLIGALLMQTTVSVMAIAIVRERERGTLEALVVSPIRRWELLLGKIIPNLLVAYGQMTMALIVAHFVFEVPIRGSLALLYGLSAVFMWGTLGIGILVSAASRTVSQAMQLSFMTFLPSIYLSGLLFPIEGMPRGAQYIARIIPLTYYLRIVRGIVLKGVGLEYLWPNVLPLVAFGAVVFSLSIFRFRKQLD